jgi:type II secretory pathway pseudopilin PulG
MNLAGSASLRTNMCCNRGYAMAALLVAMSVMAILLTVALPTWRQTIQREREEELIFRGNQYSRAISAYQRKYANASPPNFDVLLEQHYLRRKFKDPVATTKDGEFQPLYVQTQGTGSAQGPGSGGTQGSAAGTQAGAAGTQGGAAGTQGGTSGTQTGTLASTTPSGGIIGVASKNTAPSIREYNGHTHYNEWQFIPLQQSTRGGGAGQGGPAGPAGRGGPGQGVQPGGQGGQIPGNGP